LKLDSFIPHPKAGAAHHVHEGISAAQ